MQPSSEWSGFFLVIDGIDGSGKSTLTRMLNDYFQNLNIPTMLTAEPSQGELGQLLRKILLDPTTPAPLDALVFAADRMDHCQSEIMPALSAGKIVISDRYRDSSLVYQTVQGKNAGITLEWMKSINRFSINPDLTILLDLDPKIALERKQKQNRQTDTQMDKFEQLEFQSKIRKLFLKLSTAKDIKNYEILDATAPIDDLFNQTLALIKKHLKSKQKTNILHNWKPQ